MPADLNALLATIAECDKEVKSSHALLADAQVLVKQSEAHLATAQEAFDRAVCEARGVAYTPPQGASIPACDVATGPYEYQPLPPPVPVGPAGPRQVTGGMAGPMPAHLSDPDDRPEGIGD